MAPWSPIRHEFYYLLLLLAADANLQTYTYSVVWKVPSTFSHQKQHSGCQFTPGLHCVEVTSLIVKIERNNLRKQNCVFFKSDFRGFFLRSWVLLKGGPGVGNLHGHFSGGRWCLSYHQAINSSLLAIVSPGCYLPTTTQKCRDSRGGRGRGWKNPKFTFQAFR